MNLLAYILSSLLLYSVFIQAQPIVFQQQLEYNNEHLITQQHLHKPYTLQQETIDYRLDAMQRLVASTHSQHLNTSYSYDLNGNLQHLQRKGYNGQGGITTIDSLYYVYPVGNNQLKDVTELATYAAGYIEQYNASNLYNTNGQLTYKGDNKTRATYNVLDRLDTLYFNNGAQYNTIYTADGLVVGKHVQDSSGQFSSITYHVGNKTYQQLLSNASPQLQAFTDLNGVYRVIPNSQFAYDIHMRDHLSNLQIAVSNLNNDGAIDSNEVVAAHSYYPYGLEIESPILSVQQTNYVSPHQLNGGVPGNKSIVQQRMQRVDVAVADVRSFYETYFRIYDPAIGRWTQMDPKHQPYESPYVFNKTNPVQFVDWLGDSGIDDNNQQVRDLFEEAWGNYQLEVEKWSQEASNMSKEDFAKYFKQKLKDNPFPSIGNDKTGHYKLVDHSVLVYVQQKDQSESTIEEDFFVVYFKDKAVNESNYYPITIAEISAREKLMEVDYYNDNGTIAEDISMYAASGLQDLIGIKLFLGGLSETDLFIANPSEKIVSTSFEFEIFRTPILGDKDPYSLVEKLEDAFGDEINVSWETILIEVNPYEKEKEIGMRRLLIKKEDGNVNQKIHPLYQMHTTSTHDFTLTHSFVFEKIKKTKEGSINDD